MILTPEEIKFLLNILSQLSIKPADKDAANAVTMVQGIIEKLTKE